MTSRRRPWLAALLSLFTPGLGHLYAGYPRLALAAYGSAWFSVALMIALWFVLPSGPANFFLGLFAFVAVYIAIPTHAAILAARQPTIFPLRRYNSLYIYGLCFLLGVLVSSVLQELVKRQLEAFRIPSAAMQPTLLVGDYLYVVKTAATRERFGRGTVVVFESVEEPGLKVIKRVVGLPGDTLLMSDGTLLRNGQAPHEAYVVHENPGRKEEPLLLAKMRDWQVEHTFGIDKDAYAPDLQNWGPLVVPPDSFFALGDNRDASYDSRYYGFIALERVLGQPRLIYFSRGPDTTGGTPRVRWSRLGQRVQ